MFIATHPQTVGEYTEAARESGEKAQGSALAGLFLRYVQEEANKLKTCLRDLSKLGIDGRAEFRKSIEGIRREHAKEVKAWKGDVHEPLFKGISKSANVRLSEAVTFSKALDLGFDADWDQSYHVIVTQARMLVNSGASKTRGRKAKSDLEKAKEFLAKLNLSQGEELELLEFISAGRTDEAEGEE